MLSFSWRNPDRLLGVGRNLTDYQFPRTVTLCLTEHEILLETQVHFLATCCVAKDSVRADIKRPTYVQKLEKFLINLQPKKSFSSVVLKNPIKHVSAEKWQNILVLHSENIFCYRANCAVQKLHYKRRCQQDKRLFIQ